MPSRGQLHGSGMQCLIGIVLVIVCSLDRWHCYGLKVCASIVMEWCWQFIDINLQIGLCSWDLGHRYTLEDRVDRQRWKAWRREHLMSDKLIDRHGCVYFISQFKKIYFSQDIVRCWEVFVTCGMISSEWGECGRL